MRSQKGKGAGDGFQSPSKSNKWKAPQLVSGRNQLYWGERLRTLGRGPNEEGGARLRSKGPLSGCGGAAVLQGEGAGLGTGTFWGSRGPPRHLEDHVGGAPQRGGVAHL